MEEKCKICGCTDYNACEDGCYWVAEELCSKCADELINQNKTLQKELSKSNEKLKKIEEYIKNKSEINFECGKWVNTLEIEKIIKGDD